MIEIWTFFFKSVCIRNTSVALYIVTESSRGRRGSPFWLTNMLCRGAFGDPSVPRWLGSCWGAWRSGRRWEVCEGRDGEQGGSRTWQMLGRMVTNHLDWRRVFVGIQETDGALQRWAKLIFNNTNSAQFGPAMTLLLPTPSVAFQKHIPTSSAKKSEAQQRRGKTLWDTRFFGKGKNGMKKAVPVIPAPAGVWRNFWLVHRGSQGGGRGVEGTRQLLGWEKQLVLGLQ